MITFWLLLACPVLFVLGLIGGDALAKRKRWTELRRLRRVRERVVEFAVRCTKEREMTLRDDDAARAIESVGRHLLKVVELAERE
jgi:hypothetical protein